MSGIQLSFGKYRGHYLSDVAQNNPSYAKWLLSQPNVPDEMKEYIKTQVIIEPIMHWGKYRNHSLKYIFANDKKYFNWLIHNKFVIEERPQLHKELVALQNTLLNSNKDNLYNIEYGDD